MMRTILGCLAFWAAVALIGGPLALLRLALLFGVGLNNKKYV